MSTATRVPETITLSGDELSADDAVTTLRRYGRWKLVKNSFIRFRYADGFTNARALALQFCLSFIPLIIAVVGLSSALHHEKFGRVVTKRVFENRQVRASRLVTVVIMARWTMASWWSAVVSWSRAQRRCLLIHAKRLSTTQMRGRRWKPVAPGRRLMICRVRVRTSFAQMSNRPG